MLLALSLALGGVLWGRLIPVWKVEMVVIVFRWFEHVHSLVRGGYPSGFLP